MLHVCKVTLDITVGQGYVLKERQTSVIYTCTEK